MRCDLVSVMDVMVEVAAVAASTVAAVVHDLDRVLENSAGNAKLVNLVSKCRAKVSDAAVSAAAHAAVADAYARIGDAHIEHVANALTLAATTADIGLHYVRVAMVAYDVERAIAVARADGIAIDDRVKQPLTDAVAALEQRKKDGSGLCVWLPKN